MEEEEFVQYTDVDTIQRRLNNIIYLACYCGLCTEKNDNLTSMYTPFEIDSLGSATVLDMLTEMFHDTANILASYFICNHCLDKIMKSYIFIQSTKQSAKVMSEYINSFESKVLTLDDQIDESLDYSETKFIILIEPTQGNIDNSNMKNADVISLGESYDENTNLISEEINKVTQTIQNLPRNDEYLELQTNLIPSKNDENINKIYNETYELTQNIQKYESNYKPIGLLPDPISNTIIYLEDDKVTPIKTKNNAFKCSICDVVMITFKEWKKHEHTYHKVDRTLPMTCRICSKVLANRHCLIEHYKRHNRSKCRLCNVVIPHPNLKSHMMDEHGVEPKEQKIVILEVTGNVEKNQCEMCFMHFNDQDQLNIHHCRFKCTECSEIKCIHRKYLMSFRLQILNKKTKFVCPDCDYVCLEKELLIGHANKAHLNYHYECDLCGAKYYSKTTLKLHIASAHAEQYICKYCDDEFKDDVERKIHMQVCINETRDFECSFCTASFNTQEELDKHDQSRHEMFPCEMCNKRFTTKHKKREHTTKTHNGLKKKAKNNLQCPSCDMIFDIKSEFTRHVTSHGPIYECRVCNKKIGIRRSFLQHCLRAHKSKDLTRRQPQETMVKQEKLALICDACGEVFDSRELFRAHRKIHMVCCTICSKMVKRASIYSHIRCHKQQMGLMKKRVSKLEKKLQCDNCDFKAVSRQQIESHTNRIHLKIKPYKCEVCGVAYCSKARLTEHVNSNHIEEKWHKCELCDKVIRNKKNFKTHMMSHTGERPRVCEVCGQGFKTTNHLNEHRRREHWKKHEGKQVECPICKSKFFVLSHLKLHIKRVHWRYKGRTFDPKLIKGLEGHEYIFQDKRIPLVE